MADGAVRLDSQRSSHIRMTPFPPMHKEGVALPILTFCIVGFHAKRIACACVFT